MKILITGATGFIGQNLIKHLILEKNYNLFAILRSQSDISLIDKRVKVFQYDSDINKLITFFQDEKFDGVVHLASLFLATHRPYDINQLVHSNIQFGTELLEASKAANVKWFINTGTFWQNYHDEPYNPVNLYAATKEAFSMIAKYYTETSNLVFSTLKLCDTFGENDTRNKIFNLWDKISKNGDILEMSKGEQLIDISHIDDVVYAYELLIKHLNSEKCQEFQNKTFAVTSNERMSLRKLSKLFEEITTKKLNIIWGARDYREREVMVPWTKGQVVPGWEQRYILRDSIKKTIRNN